jgi:hypothetical protein
MSGTDIKKLLVIGKSAKPRCFKGLKMDSLPVKYYANKIAWMTSEIFKKWLMRWDVELQRKSRKVLLILDNFAAHPQCSEWKNIWLEFLPVSTTSLVQAMDMGIIKNLKMLYRGKLVNHILDAIEETLLTSFSTAKEVSSKVNLLQAVQFVADSWRDISSKTIQNCLSHCGLNHSGLEMPETDKGEYEAISEVQKFRNYEEFEDIDNNVERYNENGDCEDEIVESILSKHQDEELEGEESDEDDTTELERVTTQMPGNLLIGYDTSCRKAMKAVHCLH